MVAGSKERSEEIPPGLLKEVLSQLSQTEFNQFIAALWQQHGWETTQEYSDAAVLAKAPENEEVQYALHTVEYRTQQEISGNDVAQHAEQHEKSEEVTPVIVTTSGFSKEAQERAKIVGVSLVDGDELINKIEWADAYETVREYASGRMGGDSVSAVKATLEQRHTNPSSGAALNRKVGRQNSGPWLTIFPGISVDRNWGLWLGVLIGSFVALVSVYNMIPAEETLVAQLTRLVLYFAAIGSLVGIVVAFYMDIANIRRAETYWNPSLLLYGLLVAFTFGIAWLLYFYKRRYHFGAATARPPSPRHRVQSPNRHA
jgi:hypothetical protein